MIDSIHSIGDARFLYTVLNGLVMIVNDPEFLMTIKIGFTIGAFYLALQGLMAGKFPAFQHLLLSLLIYSALFGLPTGGNNYKGIDVDIYDVYTDTNRKVDNVPFGIALTASMLSTLTWKLTETFEQAFHTTDAAKLTRNGYLSSLTKMMEARSKAMNQLQNNPALAQSWLNYIKECTLIGIDLKFKTVHDVFNNSDVLAALEFPSEVFGTLIYRNGQPANVTCTEAFTWLKPRMVSWFDQQLQRDNASPNRNLSLGSALQSLSQGAESSRNFLMASALLPIYHDATIEKLQDMQQPQAAIMTQQAILQRNTQWAGEQHLFLSSMRAMMAYIEGFVFAVTPLMGLLVCVGLFGVRLAFKYLMLLLWIQLWMPVLAINNLYITLVSQGAMAALSAPITSFTGVMESGPILEYWLGVGGLMAASTPALVLMLLYGSAITATHLAGRMQSGDFVNEKIPAPDIMMPGTAINQQAGWNIGPQQGATKGQIDQVVPALSSGSQLSNLVQSKDSTRKSAGLAFSQATGHAFHQRYGESVDAKEFKQFSESLGSGHSQTAQFRDDLGRDLQNRFGLSSQVSKELATSKAMELGSQSQISGGSLTPSQTGRSSSSPFHVNAFASYKKSIKGANKETHNDSIDEALSYLNNEGLSKGWDAQLQKAMKTDAGSGHQHSWMKELGVSDDQSYQKVANESLSSDSSFEQASQLQQQVGQVLNSGPAVWAHKLAESSAAMDTLKSKPYDSDFQSNAQQAFSRFQGQFANNDEALGAALVSAHLNNGNDQDMNRLGKALSQAGLITPADNMSANTQSHQTLQAMKERHTSGDHQVEKNVTGSIQRPQPLSIPRHLNQIDNIASALSQQDKLQQDYQTEKENVGDRFHQSAQHKSQVTGLLKNTAFGNQASTAGKGIKMLPSEAFDKGKQYGLTDTQSMMFASLVADRHPHYDRSASAGDRMERLGQAVAEVSRGWGEEHSATLGWHAMNHLSHAADNPQYTNTGLQLIGEMNRLYQPELKHYQQSVDDWLKGQTLYPMEGNYLDTSMPPDNIGDGVKQTLEQREKDNNRNLFGDSEKGRFEEGNGRAVRLGRDIKSWVAGMVKPE